MYFETDPYNFDTDGEGISDFDEVKKKNSYFTDPLNPNSDRDGLYDSTEYKLSKNPLIKNESLPVVRTVSSMSQSVTVSVYGDSNLTVCHIKVFESDSILLKSIKGVVGSPVEVSLSGYKMDHASITFSYSEASIVTFHAGASAKISLTSDKELLKQIVEKLPTPYSSYTD